ncbi:hypothetical protein OSB04_024594 [Centaurea solstitialis]|uniref:Uncharacterized protein n=1 Tax=Centaurea solstitialis TaxID=347529 RepID=A0AA38T4W9_9ASTR|nr:hypothetical protein OSB04_024594 [Centaurea solstitialis]
MAINIQLSRNLGTLGLHELFSMMVQHEDFITGGRSKRAVDPLALSVVPFGGPNTAPVQPMPYNSVSPQYYPEEYSQEFNPNYGSSVQHPDEPVIISISDDELFHVNESLALISHSVQRLNANRGYNRGRGSGFPSGGRMGQGRGGHYQPERGQYGNQGRGNYQQGGMQVYDQGGYRNNQGRFREDQGRYRDQPRRDNTYLDYQGGQGGQGNWRGQVSDINYRNSLRQYTPESGYIERQGYEFGYGGRHESGRLDQGPGYGNHGEVNIKFQLLSEERTRLFSKIQELEDNNFKRGQSEQTLSILTQHAKKNPFYKAKPGLGLSENHVLDKAPSHLYNFEDMAASKPKPAIVGGHVTEEFVRQTVTYTEVINGETITTTISPTNSTSSSPPTSPTPNRPIFVPASDPTNSKPTWEGIKARTPRVAMPPINYTDLNSSYETREMELSEETLVIPPEDSSATKSPDLVRLEKEVFALRLKAMDLDACQHQILNLKVIVSEKDSRVRNLEKDLLEANAERIRLSSECETATSGFTDFQIKVADLQARYVILDIHFELLKELDHDERIMYRQSLTNQRVSNSILKRKVMNLENLFFSDSVDDKTAPILNHPIVTPQPKPVLDTGDYYSIISDDDEPPNSHHRIAEPKTVQDPDVENEDEELQSRGSLEIKM